MTNLYPKYLHIDLKDLPDDSLMNTVHAELSKHVDLDTESSDQKALVAKAKGIFSFYEARKVISPKQKERIIEYLLTIGV